MRNNLSRAAVTTERVVARVGADIRVGWDALPSDVRWALVDELTFPNPQHRSLERMGRYAGHVPEHLVAYRQDGGDLVLPRGMGSRLRELLGDALYVEDLTAAFDPVEVTFRGTLRPYQRAALEAALRQRDGVVVAVTGAGKTVLSIAWIAARRQRTLFVVHTAALADQTAAAAKRFLGVEAGRIGGGRWDVGHVLTVATVQTLVRNLDKLADMPFGAVVFDECHHVPASTFFEVATRLPARFRFGLTATPTRTDGLDRLITATLGPVAATIEQADLQAAGVNVQPSLIWVETEFTYSGDPTEFTRLVTALTEDTRRNELALQLLEREAKAGHTVLALTARVKHARALAEALRGRGVGAEALVGNVPADRREAMLAAFRAGDLSVLTATSVADEGLDVPELDRLVLLSPQRAAGRVTQRLGRLMRARPGKEPVVYDFRDVRVGLLESQARSRWFGVYRHIVADESRIGGVEAWSA